MDLQPEGVGYQLLTRKTDGNFATTTIDSTGALTVQGLATLETGLQTNNSQLRVKISPWTGTTYGIGMKSGMTFGGLNNYAMTFQMDATADRGWWWGTSSHTDAQGAMALTNAGKLTVNHSLRLGYGVNDTTTPGATHTLDVSGTISSGAITSSGDITTTADLYLDGGRAIFDTDTGTQPFQLNRIGIGTTHNQSLKMWVDDGGTRFLSEQDEAGRYGGYYFDTKHGTTTRTAYQIEPATGDSIWYNDSNAGKLIWDASAERVGIVNVAPDYTLDVTGEINATSKYRMGGQTVVDSSRNVYANYTALGNGIRASGRGELHLNATGENVVSEIFFGYGSGYAGNDNNIRWGISDRGTTTGTLVFYKGPANNNGAFYAVANFSAGHNRFNVVGGYDVNGTTVIDSDSFRGREYIRHYNSSNVVMTMNHDTYTMLRNPLGETRIWVGSSGYSGATSDTNNYYNGSTHFLETRVVTSQQELADLV